ncbi:MAG: type IX secretion system sortase PorU [Bacteroidota bacterium]
MFFTFGFSQKTEIKEFNLNWNDDVKFILNSGKQITIPLINDQLIDENNIPLFTTTFNANKGVILHNYKLNNVKYETLSKSYLTNLPINQIPDKLISDFNISKRRDQYIGVLKLTPLVREGNQVKKVVSFSLEYQTVLSKSEANKKQVPPPIFSDNSVLSTGTWYKFAVDTTGVFKIDKSTLNKIGVNTSNLNPKNIRIYGNGGNLLPQLNSEFRYDDLQENAIYVEGENDGAFDNGDYVLFYAKGPDSWNLNSSGLELTNHVNNIYSEKAYYFITVDKGQGKRITQKDPIEQPAGQTISTFQDFLVHEFDEKNLFANGQQWMGEDFSFNETQNFRFNFENIDGDNDLFVRVRALAISSMSSNMQVSVNGNDLMQLNFPGISSGSLKLAIPAETIQRTQTNNENIDIRIIYNNGSNPSAKAFLDYIEILGTKKLTASGKQFSFRNLSTTNLSSIYEYQIQNSNNIFQLWDVSDQINPKIISNQSTGSDFIFKAPGSTAPKEFIVLGNDNYFTPEVLDNNIVENQNLHQLQDIDYLIITQDYLISEAQRLANYHKQNSGFKTAVVDIEKLYNEFGSGSPDLTAIRDFVRFLYLTASTEENRIRYLVLFGDTSFDFKDRISDNNNIVPAFQSFESFNLARGYVTDDYFGMMDDNEGELIYSDQQDVATGRFPVSSSFEAKAAIDKTLHYFSSSTFGDWRNKITVIADDPDKPGEFVLQETVELIARDIETNKPEFNIKRIYSDAFPQETSAGGERYPEVNTAIDNAIESGTLVIDYFGHGGADGWANERILEIPQIQNWKNLNTLPLLVTITCEFSRFDNPLRPTGGEYVFWNPQGGSTNMITTTREIFISVGQQFNKKLVKKLFQFNGEDYTISEALISTKNEFNTAQRFFIYNFGDPAMHLAQAKPNIKITKMNGVEISQKLDTLKALSKIKLEGVVTDISGNILNDFNGEISTTIYDKALAKTTLDNDNFGRTMSFKSIESKVFKGRASVNNGNFTLDFIVPKDIRIAYGKSKLSFYADDKSIDKTGYNFDVTIGGIDSNAPDDTQGPGINLYLNDETFVDGGETNGSPLLLAVLNDDSGINTSITAVDHDIIAILDNDEANPIILNDYYETELDNFKKGKVKYQLRNLESGMHQIKFKCWDTYNNLSISTLNFIVVNSNDLVLSNVLNYPNPFVNYTEFWFNHNKPNELLDTQVQIFTISGKLIKTINQAVQTNGSLSREITWNGLDDFGNKIGKGVYIYKLKVRSSFSKETTEKVEKLVILQ